MYQVPDKYIDLPSQAFKVKLKYIKLAQHLNDDEKLKKIDSELNDLIGNADGRRMLAKFYCVSFKNVKCYANLFNLKNLLQNIFF